MNVFFQPYVGKDYTTGGLFGKRIMVLGESHYCDEGCADCGNVSSHRECMAFTNGVVGDYLNEQKPRERWMSTFLKFERSLVGHETDWPERQRIWQSVLFYNYLQVAMGGPRKAGTAVHSMSSPGATDCGGRCRAASAGRTVTTSPSTTTRSIQAATPSAVADA